MGDPLLYDFKGLVTAPGLLARAEASCIATKNVVFDAPGVVRKRRGFRRLAAIASGVPWKVFSSTTWGANVLISRGLTAGATGLQFGDGTAAWVGLTLPDAGNVRGVPSQRIEGAQSLRSFYVAAQDAPVRLEPGAGSLGTSIYYAGMPRGIAAHRGGGVATIGATLLPDGYARAYRVTWHRYDDDGVLLSGPPTGRFVIRNQAGTIGYVAATVADPIFGFYIPMEWGTEATPLTTNYFWRLWGTRTFNAAAGEDGDDEMYLLQERYLTAPELVPATYTVVVTDNTPNDYLQRQQALNTNAIDFPIGELGRAQGIVNADEPPPVAYEVASWANVTWWADVRYRPQGVVTFLSTGAPNGLQDGDTVTAQINATPVTLTAKLVPAAANDFQLYTALGTVQMNLEATAQAYAAKLNLVCWNAGVGSIGMRAYPVGLPTSMGGVVMIESLKVDTAGTGLQFVSSRATWYQYDGSASGFVQAGIAAEARNALCYSKPDRADAVPLINRFKAGPNNARILRVQPFRDRLFVFTDQGAYVVTGRSFADFSMQEYALDLKLLARESLAVCDDAVYAWCTQGIAKISDGGWEIVSTPIEPTIQNIVREAAAVGVGPYDVASLAFAIADTDQHRVLFWYPLPRTAPAGVNGCGAALVLDTRTGAWSQYALDRADANGDADPRAHGCVRLSDQRVLEGYLFEEKKDFAATDFVDDFSMGTNIAVDCFAEFQFLVPEAGGAVHWQQTVLQLDGQEISWRPLPTSVSLIWTTESQTANSAANIAPTTRVLRIEPPRAVRRGNQLKLRVKDNAAAYFGLCGVAQRFLPGTIFPRRTR